LSSIPEGLADAFFFLVADLEDSAGTVSSITNFSTECSEYPEFGITLAALVEAGIAGMESAIVYITGAEV